MFVSAAPVQPEPDPVDPDVELAAALVRNLATKGCPDYLRDAATPWLASRSTT